jgi:predicted aspartyl protease
MGCAHAPPPLHAAKLDIEGFFERNHRAVSATVNGVPARMLIDTGACRAPG